ncbi:MAG: hypothetical protein IPK02_14775 [Candidatus Accumulibacter sp.]|uniref:Uncharacterized protein n=1 Tax=Candidatus Accumulibacter affinis TaxID=2954384 RepID=A0A935TAK1_9PROT|nr:hypothetical protein [Candidatus Accumulibacter affinis]
MLSEFLEHALGDSEAQKQDGELRGFVRLSDRLKTLFPGLPILLLLDGLYANGPVMQRCRGYHWQFMIVLKDKDLSPVWQEFHALHALKAWRMSSIPWHASPGSYATCIGNSVCAAPSPLSAVPAPLPGSIPRACACSSPNRSCCNSNNLPGPAQDLFPSAAHSRARERSSPDDHNGAPTTSHVH